MNRIFGIGLLIFFTGLLVFIFNSKETNTSLFFDSKNICDTTQVPDFTVFDIANAINAQTNFQNDTAKLFLLISDNELNKLVYSYDAKLNIFQEINRTEQFKAFNYADSVALKALILPNPKLYDRWARILKPFREEFLNKRSNLFEKLPEKLPNYDFRVVSDFRNADNQAKLLSKGKSASPLSAHQFGLASDVAIKRKGRYLTGYTFYKIMGNQAMEEGLIWGGNFVGFVDPGHIQFFENSAKMLSEMPELAFEFGPFKKYFEQRIEKMEKAGKGKSVEDTKELVQILDLLSENKLCICQLDSLKKSKQNEVNLAEYQSDRDYLISINTDLKKMKIYNATGQILQFSLGKWQ